MSPFIEAGTDLKVLNERKFVRVDGRIFYPEEHQTGLYHSELATKLEKIIGSLKNDERFRPIVDDAGTMSIKNGKIAFGSNTTTCAIKDKDKATFETARVAKQILGEDKVF